VAGVACNGNTCAVATVIGLALGVIMTGLADAMTGVAMMGLPMTGLPATMGAGCGMLTAVGLPLGDGDGDGDGDGMGLIDG